MIDRKLDRYIEQFYATGKSALLLTGARQTGKTFAVRRYAERTGKNLIEINFYEDETAKNIFVEARDAKDVLLRISAHTHRSTSKENTLIFFDEVLAVGDAEFQKKGHRQDEGRQSGGGEDRAVCES